MVYLRHVTHYAHKNLVSGISSWENKKKNCRNFYTLEKHNETLVNNINSVVKENDVLYFLGNWSFGGVDNIMIFRKKLICKNIHLILGNHDKVIFQKQRSFIGPGMFLSVSQIKNITIEDQKIVLCHFPMRTWENASKGAWMLHGHSHGTLHKYEKKRNFWRSLLPFIFKKQYYKTMDVGIDCHPEFKPYSFEGIKAIMEGRYNLNDVDQHKN